MATFNDLPSEIQALIFKAKDDLEDRDKKLKVYYESKKRRELFGIANEFWRESGLDVEDETDKIINKYKDSDMMILTMLKAKLKYHKLKEEKFEDKDWADFDIPSDSDDDEDL